MGVRIGAFSPSFKVWDLGLWTIFLLPRGAEGGGFKKGKKEGLWQ